MPHAWLLVARSIADKLWTPTMVRRKTRFTTLLVEELSHQGPPTHPRRMMGVQDSAPSRIRPPGFGRIIRPSRMMGVQNRIIRRPYKLRRGSTRVPLECWSRRISV